MEEYSHSWLGKIQMIFLQEHSDYHILHETTSTTPFYSSTLDNPNYPSILIDYFQSEHQNIVINYDYFYQFPTQLYNNFFFETTILKKSIHTYFLYFLPSHVYK